MNISAAAQRSGVPPKTIRYYEEIGLVRPLREDNGYRSFQDSDVHKLTFLGKARALGFGIDDCRALLALWEDEARTSAEVKRIANGHLSEIDTKIAGLLAMRATLAELIEHCRGDSRPDCPIIKSLEP